MDKPSRGIKAQRLLTAVISAKHVDFDRRVEMRMLQPSTTGFIKWSTYKDTEDTPAVLKINNIKVIIH